MSIRSPIVVVMGHVDHGKTTILDAIRKSHVAKKEAGGITQMIGASYVSKENIELLGANLAKKMNIILKIPGLLFIDTPGHEVFTNLRDRGGSIADIAILVVDVMQGLQPQTIESIKILRHYKTPFIIAANKIDLIKGWNNKKSTSFLESLPSQQEHVKEILDEKIYSIMGSISGHGFDSERFDRITDFGKQVAIIPLSAKTNEGIGELLMLISGLSQKYMEDGLKIEVNGPGKASVMEIKEEKGMGTTADIILYDGIIKKGDEVIFLAKNGSKTAKIRGLFEPNVSAVKQDEKYKNVDKIVAASGIKILANGLDECIAGSPLNVVSDLNEDKKLIEQQFKEVLIQNEHNGVIVRADSLGSVEAMLGLLREKNIPVKNADVGKITKKDVIEAHAVGLKNRFLGVVLGFNISIMDDAKEEAKDKDIPIIWSNIIYKIIEDYENWATDEKEREKKEIFSNLTYPCRIKILAGCCFRMCKPAICGIEVLDGKLKVGDRLMNKQGEILGEVKTIQENKENIKEATKGMQVAISSQ
ncbi:MAG: translation initiation factor IF-2, partial [Candidatus Paceibacterota bacterium]